MADHKKKKKSRPYRAGGAITADKAKEILRDGKIRGVAITAKQKAFFGFVAGGGKPSKKQLGGLLEDPDDQSGQVEFRESKKESFLGEQTFTGEVDPTVEDEPIVIDADKEKKERDDTDFDPAAISGIGSAVAGLITTEQARKKREQREKIETDIEGINITGTSSLKTLAELEKEEAIRSRSFKENFDQGETIGLGALSGASAGASAGGSSGGGIGALIGSIGGGLLGAFGGVSASESAKQREALRSQEARTEIAGLKKKIAQENRNVEGFGFVDGGKIVGKGTGTSDSIHGKLRAGSFVVPARNAGIAEKIRTEILGKINKKAKLRGGGGVEVSVSNGEHVFSPAEVKKITKAGVNLNLLAPKADSKLSLQEGGTVIEQSTIDRIEQRIKLLNTQGKTGEAQKVQQQLETLKTTFRQQQTRAINEAFATRVSNLNTQLQATTNVANAERIKKQLDSAKNLQEEALNASVGRRPLGGGERVRFAKEKVFSDENIKRFRGQLGDAPVTTTGTEEVVDDLAQPSVSVVPTTTTSTQRTTSGRRSASQIAKDAKALEELKGGKAGDVRSLTDAVETALTPQEKTVLDPTETVEDVKQRQAQDLKQQEAGAPKGLNLADVASIGQIGLGVAQLAGQGTRPVGKRPVELERIQGEIEGLESQFEFPIQQELRDISSQERSLKELAVQTGGGSTGGIFAKSVIASAQAQKQKASLRERKAFAEGRVADQFAFRKLGLAANLAQGVERSKRQLFEDKLTAFKENQAASANLLNAGISNIVGSQQLKEARRRERLRKDRPIVINFPAPLASTG